MNKSDEILSLKMSLIRQQSEYEKAELIIQRTYDIQSRINTRIIEIENRLKELN